MLNLRYILLLTATSRSGNGNCSGNAKLNRYKLVWSSKPDLHTSSAITIKQRDAVGLVLIQLKVYWEISFQIIFMSLLQISITAASSYIFIIIIVYSFPQWTFPLKSSWGHDSSWYASSLHEWDSNTAPLMTLHIKFPFIDTILLHTWRWSIIPLR